MFSYRTEDDSPRLKTRLTLILFVMASSIVGQTFEVKDRNGAVVLIVDNVKMFRYSEYFKEDIPDFQGTVKKVSDDRLFGVSICGIVHRKDGGTVKFDLAIEDDSKRGWTHKAIYPFRRPWPFQPADFDSVEFMLDRAQRLTTEEGLHVAGFIAKDEGCLKDYLATESLAGVTLRKKLAELLEYGCGFVADPPLAATISEGSKKTFGVGAKKVAVIKVFLLDEGSALGRERSRHAFEFGWVPVAALTPGPVLTREEIGVTTR